MIGNHKLRMLLDRTTITVPVAHCQVNTPWCSGQTDVLCIDDPVYDLIIGTTEGVHSVCDMEQVYHFEEEDILLEDDAPGKYSPCYIPQNKPTPVIIEMGTHFGMCRESSSDESIGDRNIDPLVVRYPVDINTSASDFKQAQKEDLSLDKVFLMTKRTRRLARVNLL